MSSGWGQMLLLDSSDGHKVPLDSDTGQKLRWIRDLRSCQVAYPVVLRFGMVIDLSPLRALLRNVLFKVFLPTGTMSSLSSMKSLCLASRHPSPWSSNAKETLILGVE